MRGTLGPNLRAEPITVVLTGAMGKGARYRSVSAEREGDPIPGPDPCEVEITTFRCELVLAPGDEVSLAIRVFVDALNAPDTVRQRLSAATGTGGESRATVTASVGAAVGAPTAAEGPPGFEILRFPLAFLPLLALLLYALAASVAARSSDAHRPHPPVPTSRSTP
ncbi:hypothetical protein G3H63_19090 [Microbacterium resistens]|nr:hypothetical protein [Microbacterium resistens]MBW1641169.1 hypothetical protein [Microbacterium resistens]